LPRSSSASLGGVGGAGRPLGGGRLGCLAAQRRQGVLDGRGGPLWPLDPFEQDHARYHQDEDRHQGDSGIGQVGHPGRQAGGDEGLGGGNEQQHNRHGGGAPGQAKGGNRHTDLGAVPTHLGLGQRRDVFGDECEVVLDRSG
jgi:hypothetical protein